MEQNQLNNNGGWSFLQANLGRSKPATGELPTIQFGPHDIFVIQEPYTINGWAGLPTSWRVVHAQDGKTAILVRNTALDVMELVKSSYITTV
ncbi:hypothetical protein AVEN_126264-1 [Araneus ventricosus]|uniref:Uncharacterized protein n=1 Tax=Araneus ventricosus TaxID=182803 RepID=A0A4Y2L3H3_ARAVE|nr:hypothetical protein AVEN_126264-1 [Araneus ventricosus]